MAFDTHIHTEFSSDSRMDIQAALAQAKKLNIGIIVTEHMDLDYPDAGKFLFDVPNYFHTYSKYRSDKVLLGIEIGMRTDCAARNVGIVSAHAFDFVIGSVHVVDNTDIYCEHFYRNRSKQDTYQCYLEGLLACINCHDFVDSIGHLDYICRYSRYHDPEIYYDEFKEGIDAVLQAIVNRGKALEINTRRLDDQAAVENMLSICKRFHELGGKLTTIGSDAHQEENIGCRLNIGWDIAEAAGLKVVYFKNREPIFDEKP